VIAADSLGPGMLIRHGESGLLVPVDDAAALGRSIKHLAENPTLRERLAEGGRAAYEADHTEKAVIDKYLQFFSQIIR
jgi:glycosyltransferase involved in cell wall biosynthesis